jgi:hypothetical protein
MVNNFIFAKVKSRFVFSDPPSVRVESSVEEIIEGQIQEIKHFLYSIFWVILCFQILVEQRGLKIHFLMNFEL